MSYTFLGIGALIGLLVGGGYYALAEHQHAAHAAARAAAARTAPATHHIALLRNHAEPAELLIHTGDVLMFDTEDGLTHVIAQGVGNGDGERHSHDAGLESAPFGTGEAFRVVLKKPGAYYFHDHEHPDIHVSVAVYDPSAASRPSR